MVRSNTAWQKAPDRATLHDDSLLPDNLASNRPTVSSSRATVSSSLVTRTAKFPASEALVDVGIAKTVAVAGSATGMGAEWVGPSKWRKRLADRPGSRANSSTKGVS